MPGDSHLFPDTDWLIGNHSDELTPWIPVIAARSSYSCRYFVLPCCFFDFHGKYSRKQSKKTQYREYLDFVAEVGSVCGFHVEEDCLRIPSTKRVCLIGKNRTYPSTECALIDNQITRYIHNRQTCPVVACDRGVGCNHKDCSDVCKGAGSGLPGNELESSGRIWMPGFQPREKVEQIRNCAALPRDFVDDVVLNVANLLLNTVPQKSCSNTHGGNMNTWNQGERLGPTGGGRGPGGARRRPRGPPPGNARRSSGAVRGPPASSSPGGPARSRRARRCFGTAVPPRRGFAPRGATRSRRR